VFFTPYETVFATGGLDSLSLSTSHRFVSLWLTLFAFSFAGNLAVHWPRAVTPANENVNIALAFQRGEGFSNPFSAGPSGPTAHASPIYPLILGAVYSIFGTSATGSLAVLVLTTAVWALQCAFVQLFASLHGVAQAGTIAAFVLAIPPFHGALLRGGEAFTAATIAGSACLFSVILARRGGMPHFFLLGGLMAVGTLLNPATIVIWAAWSCLLVYRTGLRAFMKVLLPVALIFLIPVGAWTARNFVVFRHLIFVRDNMGLELAASYNDCALTVMSPLYHPACYTPFHPNTDPNTARALIANGEYEFYEMCKREAKKWILAHPMQSVAITAGHVFYFWFPLERAGTESLIDGIGMSIVTMFSLLGIFWRGTDGFKIAVSGAASFSLVYSLFRAVPRFRYPVLWITVLLAVIGIEAWISKRRRVTTG
jgi:hypothetical protein